MPKLDADAYSAGERAGREGTAADSNPHVESGLQTIATILYPPAALLSTADDDKASSWAEGHSAGSRNKK